MASGRMDLDVPVRLVQSKTTLDIFYKLEGDLSKLKFKDFEVELQAKHLSIQAAGEGLVDWELFSEVRCADMEDYNVEILSGKEGKELHVELNKAMEEVWVYLYVEKLEPSPDYFVPDADLAELRREELKEEAPQGEEGAEFASAEDFWTYQMPPEDAQQEEAKDASESESTGDELFAKVKALIGAGNDPMEWIHLLRFAAIHKDSMDASFSCFQLYNPSREAIQGIETTDENALWFLRRAAKLGHKQALSALGDAFQSPQFGLQRSFSSVIFFRQKSAQLGDAMDMARLARNLCFGSVRIGADIPRVAEKSHPQRGKRLLKESNRRCSAAGHFNSGRCLLTGDIPGMEEDVMAAKHHFDTSIAIADILKNQIPSNLLAQKLKAHNGGDSAPSSPSSPAKKAPSSAVTLKKKMEMMTSEPADAALTKPSGPRGGTSETVRTWELAGTLALGAAFVWFVAK